MQDSGVTAARTTPALMQQGYVLVALDRCDDAAAAFAQARSFDLTHFFRALPRVAAELAGAALELDVETAFARKAPKRLLDLLRLINSRVATFRMLSLGALPCRSRATSSSLSHCGSPPPSPPMRRPLEGRCPATTH